MRRWLLVCAMAACGSESTPTAGDAGVPKVEVTTPEDAATPLVADDAGQPGPRYNEVQQKSVHNAYDHYEPFFDQIVFHRAHSVEIDINNTKRLRPDLTGDWYVYHIDAPGLNNTSCDKLSDCLGVLRAYGDAFPDHEVVTVLVDLKSAFNATHGIDALDAAFVRALGSAVFTPADLAAACPGAKTLREAVTGACAFPRLSSMRGKFVFVLTGGNACTPGGQLDTYGRGMFARKGFVAPGIDDACPFPAYAAVGHSIFFNMDKDHLEYSRAVRNAGLVGRVYYGGLTGGLDQPTFAAALAAGTHLLATDAVNYQQDPWTITHGPEGYPFKCEDPKCNAPAQEMGRVVGVDVRSGDIDGTTDSFAFLLDEVTEAKATWTATVSVPSSHVEPFAKGCLMARASKAAGSPYFAVCRPADNRPMRVQYRSTAGGDTTIVEGAAPPGLTSEALFAARLTVDGNTVTGEVSADGKTFVKLAERTFALRLPLQGIAASGHDSPVAVRLLFGNVTRTGGTPAYLSKTSAAQTGCVGTCPIQTWFDGVLP